MEVDIALRSKLVLLFVFTPCLLVPSIQARDIKYCNKKANYVVKVDDVDISPDPVVTGEPTTFTIKALTNQALTGGKMVLDVSYFGIKVHSESHSICEKTSCPISSGKFVLSHTQTLPEITPPGSYTLKMKMEDEKGRELTCASFNFQIKLRSYQSSI
ncbi:hypothetical protein U1Q18_032491 [Sarracenia purpurea var. burkii]